MTIIDTTGCTPVELCASCTSAVVTRRYKITTTWNPYGAKDERQKGVSVYCSPRCVIMAMVPR